MYLVVFGLQQGMAQWNLSDGCYFGQYHRQRLVSWKRLLILTHCDLFLDLFLLFRQRTLFQIAEPIFRVERELDFLPPCRRFGFTLVAHCEIKRLSYLFDHRLRQSFVLLLYRLSCIVFYKLADCAASLLFFRDHLPQLLDVRSVEVRGDKRGVGSFEGLYIAFVKDFIQIFADLRQVELLN